jgi:hypothetical protein
VEHLEKTHLPFLKKVLELHSKLSVILISKPDFDADPDAKQRRAVILESYDWLKAQRVPVSFVDGENLFDGPMRDACTVDRCHPNDLGFYRMAEQVWRVLSKIVK